MNTKSYNYIDIHTHQKSGKHNITEIINILSTQIDEVAIEKHAYYSIGIHPWHISSEFIIEKIKILCQKKNVIAIGEFGIDRAIDTQTEIQTDYFIKQLELAMSLNKPAIIHCVRAYSDILSILKKMKPVIPLIFHDFNESLQIYNQLSKYNSFFSFGARIMDTESKANKIFKKIDMEKVFLETDNAFISIEELYNKAGFILGVDIDFLKKQFYINFNRCFTRL